MKSSLVVLFLAFCPSAAKPRRRAHPGETCLRIRARARGEKERQLQLDSYVLGVWNYYAATVEAGIPDGYAKDDIVEWGESLGYNLCKGRGKVDRELQP